MKSLPLIYMGIHKGIYAGRFLDAPSTGFVTVKMAAEINRPCTISIPTEDFSVPSVEAMTLGLEKAIKAFFSNQPMYVGCMGGIGRTGLFLALMTKILNKEADPVMYVRGNYYSHAVETSQQLTYVKEFDVRKLRRYAFYCAVTYKLEQMLFNH